MQTPSPTSLAELETVLSCCVGTGQEHPAEHPAEFPGSCSNYSEQCHLLDPVAEGQIFVFLGFCSRL